MKLKLKRNIRRGIILLCAALSAGTAAAALWWFLQPEETATEVPALTYKQEASVNYRVYFKPNDFFPEESAGPGKAYINAITDYIKTFFTYRFSVAEEAEIEGEYRVTAHLDAYVLKEKPGTDEKERVKLWGKTEVLLPPAPFAAEGRTATVSASVPVEYPRYAAFVGDVREEFKFSPDIVELRVVYAVNVKARTGHGEINEEIAPVMVIPLRGNVFTVEGRLAEKKDGAIMTAQTVPVQAVIENRAKYAAVAGLSFLALLFVLFGTVPVTQPPWEQKLCTIMKKHGDRVVACREGLPVVSGEKVLTVHSFADLVKVADELAQPVLYTAGDGRHSFYVLTEPLSYVFTLEAPGGQETAAEKEL